MEEMSDCNVFCNELMMALFLSKEEIVDFNFLCPSKGRHLGFQRVQTKVNKQFMDMCSVQCVDVCLVQFVTEECSVQFVDMCSVQFMDVCSVQFEAIVFKA